MAYILFLYQCIFVQVRRIYLDDISKTVKSETDKYQKLLAKIYTVPPTTLTDMIINQ